MPTHVIEPPSSMMRNIHLAGSVNISPERKLTFAQMLAVAELEETARRSHVLPNHDTKPGFEIREVLASTAHYGVDIACEVLALSVAFLPRPLSRPILKPLLRRLEAGRFQAH